LEGVPVGSTTQSTQPGASDWPLSTDQLIQTAR
jgi:hypothetical protein